jgi:hypothetical protein
MKRLSFILVLLTVSTIVYSSSIADLKLLVTDINNAQKVDELYTYRMNLKRIPVSGTLTPEELQLRYRAYLGLANGFSRRNHYRNGVEAYRHYLQYKEKHQLLLAQMSLDSLALSQQAIQQKEDNKINRLDQEIASLEENQRRVSELRTSYQTWGGIISVILILGLTYLIFSKQKQINKIKRDLEENKGHVMKLSGGVVHSALLEGAQNLSQSMAAESMNALQELFATQNESEQQTTNPDFDDDAVKNLFFKFKTLLDR